MGRDVAHQASLGLRVDVDFRGAAEAAEKPNRLPVDVRAELLPIESGARQNSEGATRLFLSETPKRET